MAVFFIANYPLEATVYVKIFPAQPLTGISASCEISFFSFSLPSGEGLLYILKIFSETVVTE